MSQRKLKKLKKSLVSETRENVVAKYNFVGIRSILKTNWLFLLVLITSTIAIYFNSLGGDFVSDDYASIAQNPGIVKFNTGLLSHFIGLSNWAISNLFGLVNPIPFHVFSLFLYICFLVLGFIFVYFITNRKIAIITMILFAVLPLHVEAVSWISGKPYLFSSTFIILSAIFSIAYLKTGKSNYLKYLFLSLPFTFFADKVRFPAYLLIMFWYLIIFKKENKVDINWTKVFIFSGLLLLIALVVLLPVILDRINSVNSGYNASDSLFYNPFFQYPTSIAKYLQLALFPFDLTLYHTMYVFPVWLNWLITILFIANTIYFSFKNKYIAFGLGFIFLATAPSMAPIKVSWLVAERYLFMGSLGLVLVFVLVLESISQKLDLYKWGLVAIITVLFGYRVVIRNVDWQTNHNLWVNTCQVSPNSHNAWNNIGDDYDKLKDYTNAIKGFTQSTIVKPNYADAYHNRANIFFKMGRLDLARDSYMTALQYSPQLFHSYLSLTQIDLMEKRMDLAIQHAQTVVQLQPGNPQSWYVFGIVASQLGDMANAKIGFEKSLEIDPNYKIARDALVQLQINGVQKS